MLLNNSFKLYAALRLGTLASILNVREVSARVVGSSDIRENIKESKSFAKNKGDECIKLEADISGNKKDIENVDVGVLGCGEALICLEDESSSTGSRCVDSEEVFVKDECLPEGAVWCSTDSDCCGTTYCEILEDEYHRKCIGQKCFAAGEQCTNDSDCCAKEGDATGYCIPDYCDEYSGDCYDFYCAE